MSPVQLAPPEPAEPDESAVRDEPDSPRRSSPADHGSLDDSIVHSSDAADLSSSACTNSPAALPPCDRQQLEASVFDLRVNPLRPTAGASTEDVEQFFDALEDVDDDAPVHEDEDRPTDQDGWTFVANVRSARACLIT